MKRSKRRHPGTWSDYYAAGEIPEDVTKLFYDTRPHRPLLFRLRLWLVKYAARRWGNDDLVCGSIQQSKANNPHNPNDL